jgi:lysophospholipase L1-like esterase
MSRGRDLQTYDVTRLAKSDLSPELETAWAHTISEIDGIRRLAEKHRKPLLLIIAPYQFQLADPRQLNRPQRRLLEYAKQHGVPVVDLLPFFAQFAEERPLVPLFVDANHFSVAGHEVSAWVLAGVVGQMLDQLSLNAAEGSVEP